MLKCQLHDLSNFPCVTTSVAEGSLSRTSTSQTVGRAEQRCPTELGDEGLEPHGPTWEPLATCGY